MIISTVRHRREWQRVLEHLSIQPQVALIDAMPVQAQGIETASIIIHGDAFKHFYCKEDPLLLQRLLVISIMERLDVLVSCLRFCGQ